MRLLKAFLIALAFVLCADRAVARSRIKPSEYGSVTIRNFSHQAGLAPVRFDHWLHRSLYTCRLCHVDIGFAMEANATGITADANMKGFYCGSCHNGTRLHDKKVIFASCSVNATPEERMRCSRCHSVGKNVQKEYTYAPFAEKLPKGGMEELIDWEKAEARGLIHPVDFLLGVSMQRQPLNAQKDFSITSRNTWMPDIIFSHKKHVMWNGCEVCHPDIFPSVKKGVVKYSMLDIANGLYCGLCHNRVAFPLNECGKCHANPVQ
jgi:c(7)-type cytochrome triheme protein